MRGGLKREVVLFTILYILSATMFYALTGFFEITSEVQGLYYQYANLMLHSQMPYSDFSAEYPPLAMLLILIPGLFSFSPVSYQIAFGVEIYLFLLVGLLCVHKLSEMYSCRPGRYVCIYVILCLLFFKFIVDRYDIIPAIMCIVALYFFKTDRIGLAWVMIALGTMTKLYPAFIAPIFLICLCLRGRNADALKGVGICVIIGTLMMLPFLFKDPDTMLMFLTYHMDRGFQVESLMSSFFMLFDKMGLIEIGYIFNYGSDNIYGPVPDAVVGYMIYIMVAIIVITYSAYGFAVRRVGDGDQFPGVILASFIVITVFILANKVFSTQYPIWLIPLVTLLPITVGGVWERIGINTFIIASFLTRLSYFVNLNDRASGTDAFSTFGILLLIVRNLLFVIMLAWAARSLLALGTDRSDTGSSDADAIGE